MAMKDGYLDTFGGSVVSFVLDEIRRFDGAESAWMALEQHQRDARLDQMAQRADALAQRLINDTHAAGAIQVAGTLESITFKKGIKAVLNIGAYEKHRHAIADASGGKVILLLSQLPLELKASADPDKQAPLDFGNMGRDEDDTTDLDGDEAGDDHEEEEGDASGNA